MYLEYYGLEQAPFSITPDPHYVFLSERHRDALAHLLYGIRQGGGGGFVQLTGEVGTGKTTLSRLLLEQLPERTQAALVLNPRLDPIELMQTICEELRLPIAASPPVPAGKRRGRTAARPAPGAKALYDALSAHLLDAYARGERVVLIIDEAQNLSADALEQVRLLTNLETGTQKLLQIILIGQPELRTLLARPELRQLAQRITARYHLQPLDEAGTAAYLRHRLNIAGAPRFPFSADAVRRLHKRSGGVPRLINVIAERALLGGYAHDLLSIDGRTVDRAADEALAPTGGAGDGHRRRRALTIAVAVGVAAVALAWLLVRPWTSRMSETEPATAAPAATAQRQATPSAQPATPALPAAAQGGNAAALDGDALLRRLRALPTNDRSAWDALTAAWQAPAAVRRASPDACLPAPAPGWRCLRSRAQLEQLLHYDRPVLLRLRAEPHTGWARLLGADAARVRLALGGDALEVDRIGLAGAWNGEFLALWRAPERLEAQYAAGDAAAMDWLRTRLRDAGVDATDLPTALRIFQARNGLRSDAGLDPQTLFALTRTDTGPRLRPRQEP